MITGFGRLKRAEKSYLIGGAIEKSILRKTYAI
jgi:hypothetical protein